MQGGDVHLPARKALEDQQRVVDADLAVKVCVAGEMVRGVAGGGDGKAVQHETVQLAGRDHKGVIADVHDRVGRLLRGGDCGQEHGFHMIGIGDAVMVEGAGADGGIDRSRALGDGIADKLGGDFAILHGICSGDEVGVPLDDKIDAVCFDQIAVYAVASVTDAAEPVVNGLMLEDHGPFCVLVVFQISFEPIVLRHQQGGIVGMIIGAGVEGDEMNIPIIEGINGLIRVLSQVVQIRIGDICQLAHIQRSGAAVVGVIEMIVKIQIAVVGRGAAGGGDPGVVVADGHKEGSIRSVIAKRLEIAVPKALRSSGFNHIARVDDERRFFKRLEGLVIGGPGVLDVAPCGTLCVADGNEGEGGNAFCGGCEGVGFAPMVDFVGTALDADSVFIGSVWGEAADVALEVILIRHGICLILFDGIDRGPIACTLDPVLQGHVRAADKGRACGPGEAAGGAGVIKRSDHIVDAGLDAGIDRFAVGQGILVWNNAEGGDLRADEPVCRIRCTDGDGGNVVVLKQLIEPPAHDRSVGGGQLHRYHLLDRVDGGFKQIGPCAEAAVHPLGAQSQQRRRDLEEGFVPQPDREAARAAVCHFSCVYRALGRKGHAVQQKGLFLFEGEIVDLHGAVLAAQHEIGHGGLLNRHIGKSGVLARAGNKHVAVPVGDLSGDGITAPDEDGMQIGGEMLFIHPGDL